jgi:2-haloacid dehalogenase
MTSNKKTVIAFDLYGTLLSTESIAKELATHFGDEKAKSIAALWRRWVLGSLIRDRYNLMII